MRYEDLLRVRSKLMALGFNNLAEKTKIKKMARFRLTILKDDATWMVGQELIDELTRREFTVPTIVYTPAPEPVRPLSNSADPAYRAEWDLYTYQFRLYYYQSKIIKAEYFKAKLDFEAKLASMFIILSYDPYKKDYLYLPNPAYNFKAAAFRLNGMGDAINFIANGYFGK